MNGEKFYECIIQEISNDYVVLYSFDNGRFYLILKSYFSSVVVFNEFVKKQRIKLKQSYFNNLIDKCTDPSTVDYSNFNSPLVVGVMITNHCNLNCTYCLAKNGESYSKEDTLLKNENVLVDKLINSQIISLLISGGEPTLYKNLPLFLEKMYNSNFLIMLDTNGVHISDDLINSLKKISVFPRISLDSIDENIHNKNRGHYLETLQNIEKLINHKIEFRINTVIHNDNIFKLEDIALFLITHNIKTWHLFKLQKEFAPQNIWVDNQLVENILNHITLTYSDKLNIICKFTKNDDGFASFVIDSMGNCFSTNNKEVKSKKIIFGNIFSSSIYDIWQSTPLDYRLRHYKKHLTFRGKKI